MIVQVEVQQVLAQVLDSRDTHTVITSYAYCNSYRTACTKPLALLGLSSATLPRLS